MSVPAAAPDLSGLKVGDQIVADFALTKKERKTTKAGNKPYFAIELTNERGQRVESKIWSESMAQWEGIPLGAAVRVSGRMEEGFPNPTPLAIKVMMPPDRLPDTHPVRDTMNPKSPIPAETLAAELESTIAGVRHPGYRRFAELFFRDACPKADFLACPAAKGNHHAYIGGLAEHSFEVKNIARATAVQPEIADVVNLDLVTVGALIHDAGKIEEYVWKNVPIGMNNDVLLYNHLTTGPLMVQKIMMLHGLELAELGFTQDDAKHLIHIQVSHHSKLEYGSPTVPGTVAAQVVAQADVTSAMVRKMVTLVKASVPDEEGLIRGAAYGEHKHGLRAEPTPWLPPEEEAATPVLAAHSEPKAAPAPRSRARIEQTLETVAQEEAPVAGAAMAYVAPRM